MCNVYGAAGPPMVTASASGWSLGGWHGRSFHRYCHSAAISMSTYLARLRLPIAALAALLGLGGVAEAATYRCSDAKGRTTFQDAACADASKAATTAAPPGAAAPVAPQRPKATAGTTDPAYATARGAWRGPAQMHFTSGGVRDLAAHRVTPIVIEVGNDGRVRGVISEAGCKISGLGSQFVQPSMESLEVTLTGCADGRFNGRYNGNLSAFQGSRETRLSLSRVGITNLPRQKVEQASIEAVLKR